MTIARLGAIRQRCAIFQSRLAAISHVDVQVIALSGVYELPVDGQNMKKDSNDWRLTLLVGVVVRIIDVRLVLNGRIVPSIVDTKSNEINFLAIYATIGNLAVLTLDVACKFWSVVAAVRFSEDAEVTALVLRKVLVECL